MGGDDKKSGNARKEAISAETGRKNFDGKLPVISKTKEQSELISGNQCFRTCSLTVEGEEMVRVQNRYSSHVNSLEQRCKYILVLKLLI